MRQNFIRVLTVLLCCLSPPVWSAEVFMNLGGVSYHMDRSKDFNELNTGLGVDSTVYEGVGWEAKVFHYHFTNSIYKTTDITGLSLERALTDSWCVGLSAGYVWRGYNTPAVVLPYGCVRLGEWKVKLSYLPVHTGVVVGTVERRVLRW